MRSKITGKTVCDNADEDCMGRIDWAKDVVHEFETAGQIKTDADKRRKTSGNHLARAVRQK